jgi:hypothetical protein
MGTPKVFRSTGEMRWHEHRERCKAAIGQPVYVRNDPSPRTAATLLAVGRTLATVQYPPDPEPQQVHLAHVELS